MPYTTLSSGLTIKVPTRGTVNWAATLLAENFQKVSEHDHTGSGKGIKITQSALNVLSDATARAEVPRLGQIQDGAVIYGGTTTGSANTQGITLAPALSAVVTGMVVRFKAGFTNTSTTTLVLNVIGAKGLRKFIGGGLYELTEGDIFAGAVYEALYDGTQFILLNPNGFNIIKRESTDSATLSSSVAETTMFSFVLKAGTIGSVGKIRGFALFAYKNNSGSPSTVSFRLQGSGTPAEFCTISTVDSSATFAVPVEFELSAKDATNAQNSSITAMYSSNITRSPVNNAGTMDTTADVTINLSGSLGSSSANHTLKLVHAYVEGK